MAEALAFGASVIALIQLTDRVIDLTKFYLEALHDCPHEIRAILVEVTTLKAILTSLEFLASARAGAISVPYLLQQLSGKDGPVEGCKMAVASLEDLLPSGSRGSGGKRRDLRALWGQLAWPLKQSRAKRLLAEITQYKSSITFALTAETISDTRAIKTSLHDIQQILSDERRRDFYRWIESTNPSRRHIDSYQLRDDNTGQWILRSPEWQGWLHGSKRFLWIHGIPGAGKTVLLSFLIGEAEKVVKTASKDSRQGAVYYYCYFAHNQDEARPLLRWTIGQLSRICGKVPDEIMYPFTANHEPSLPQLLSALESILQEFDIVYLMVDALDESLPREELVKVIRDLATDQRFQKVRLLVTSREYIDIETVLSPISTSMSMTCELVEADIRVYVHQELRSNAKFKRWSENLLLEIEDALAKGAKGMFRWAACQIDDIQRRTREQDIRVALGSLPKTLDETYERIFLSIREDEREIAQVAVSLICGYDDLDNKDSENLFYSHHLVGLICSSTMKSESGSDEDLFTAHDLRDICGCLLTLSGPDENGHHELVLAHYTVREYLYSGRILSGPASQFALTKLLATSVYSKAVLTFATGCRPESWDKSYLDDSQSYLGPFCIHESTWSLNEWEQIAIQDGVLRQLYYDFLNPSMPRWHSISRYFNLSPTFSIQPPDDVNVGIFVIMIWFGLSDLAVIFLADVDAESIIYQTPITILPEDGKDGYKFNNVIAFISEATLDPVGENNHPHDHPHGHPYVYRVDPMRPDRDFTLLESIITKIYDPTTALIKYIATHNPDHFPCGLHTFIECGADPNAVRYRVTPLQVSTWRLDVITVCELLKAGAGANNAGQPNGEVVPGLGGTTWPNNIQRIPPDATPRQLLKVLEGMELGDTMLRKDDRIRWIKYCFTEGVDIQTVGKQFVNYGDVGKIEDFFNVSDVVEAEFT